MRKQYTRILSYIENNLITTCRACNIRANYNRDYWKNYYTNKLGVRYEST